MKLYKVAFGSRISGSQDYCYVLAESEKEALDKGKEMLDTHRLIPDFLNKYGMYSVTLCA